jgi:ssDNA-binding Zn-finger/Zn-ribbon topoisomerase 1
MKPENLRCPNCDSTPMVPRNGQFGKFWGCKYYPNCKGTRDSMGLSKLDKEIEKADEDQKPANERFRFNKDDNL